MTRVGIIGCGRISDLHILGYRDLSGFSIAAVCDINRAVAETKAREWGSTQAAVFDDYQELCRSGLVDLVEVIVPHHLHYPVTVYALEQGLHVSVQKPMAISLKESDNMIEIARRSPGMLKVYENFVHYPPIVRAKQLIDQGMIGEPLSIRIKSNPGDPAGGWLIPAAAREWRYDLNRAGGGPLTFDDGHHKLAVAWFLMGRIQQVYAQIGATDLGGGRVLDAPAIVTFEFAGGRMGVFEVVYSPGLQVQSDHYAQDDQVEVTGREGVLWVTRGHGRTAARPPLVVYRDGVTYAYDDMPAGWEASFIASTRNTVAAVRGDAMPSLTAEEGHHVLEAGLALQSSAASGRPVAVS